MLTSVPSGKWTPGGSLIESFSTVAVMVLARKVPRFPAVAKRALRSHWPGGMRTGVMGRLTNARVWTAEVQVHVQVQVQGELAFSQLEAGAGIEPANSGFADRSLTTWLPRRYPQRLRRLGNHVRKRASRQGAKIDWARPGPL